MPYYVGGVVAEQKELLATPVGTVRDEHFFRKVKDIVVKTRTEVITIDRKKKQVLARQLDENTETWHPYDYLVVATGATPVIPPLPGVDLDGIHTLHAIQDAESIHRLVHEHKAKDAVIIGGGLIGVETAEALADCGVKVTLVEMLPRILNMLDGHIAQLVEQHMAAKGVDVLTGIRAQSFTDNGKGAVASVITESGEVKADLVVLAVGVRPNVKLARDAGLEIGETGAIVTDDRMRTSDPYIYAAGDCAETKHVVTGKPAWIPLGSTANKQGRVAAMNICGREDRFPGVSGSTVCKVFDFAAGCTGLSEHAAKAQGYDVITACAPGPDKAHYMPSSQSILIKLIVEKNTGRILGFEGAGPGDLSKRIDVAAMAIAAGMTADDLANADLCYAPPFAPAMDAIITAANVARNKLAGDMNGISAEELKSWMDTGRDFFLLDVRSPDEYETVRIPGATLIPLGALRGRIDEVPRDRDIVCFCKISLRGYEAATMLQGAGYKQVRVLEGGVVMWPFEKET
jgi:NADPH-dependent 2,4-dienoyl-CoA reductase/sulfur reductase-like enzyme/rhodanese-related sulfurtransferase